LSEQQSIFSRKIGPSELNVRIKSEYQSKNCQHRSTPNWWHSSHLYFYAKETGFSVVQDAFHPSMWRVLSAEGQLSDMVNLTRAKDAAEVRAERCRKKPCAEWQRRAPMRQNQFQVVE
jgi:hypothetical protein